MNTKLGLEVWLETAVDARFLFRSCIKCCTKSYLFFFASFHFIVVVVLVPPSTTSTTRSHHESSGDLPMFDDCWWLLFPTQRRKEMAFFRCKFSVRRWFCVGSNINNFDHTWETVTTSTQKQSISVSSTPSLPSTRLLGWICSSSGSDGYGREFMHEYCRPTNTNTVRGWEHVPRYNGGRFDRETKVFLSDRVGKEQCQYIHPSIKTSKNIFIKTIVQYYYFGGSEEKWMHQYCSMPIVIPT